MNPPVPLAPSSWSDEQLNQARLEGDTEGDALADRMLNSALAPAAGGRFDYNHLVDLADQLEANSELLLISDSHLTTCFANYPEGLRQYYSPMVAPAWVDRQKLKLASRLWHDNSLAMLGVLYAASLPACYLIANGIPALYRTEKLRDQQYIFQRIYETGIMLDAVMDPGGLRVVRDAPHAPANPEPLLATLQELDPAGAWAVREGRLVRTNAGAPHVELKRAVVEAHLRQHQTAARPVDPISAPPVGPRHFLWGRGYLAAKKVRLLHASMRCMLLNPDTLQAHVNATSPAPGRLAENYRARRWNRETLGVPVNQEDLAYTLLTFSYLLPKGLEHWGCPITREQKDAFLHLWRVVGHIMGLRDDLMPDNWAEAEEFFRIVLQRQGRGSPNGVALTEAVAGFLKSYLPPVLGLRDHLPYTLIADLMGERAQELMAPESWARVRSLYGRVLGKITCVALVIYYRMYSLVQRFPLTDGMFGNLFHRTSEELIQSWRDEFQRRPFYVPTDLTHWQVARGVDAALHARLEAWRNRVFLGVFMPVALVGLGMPLVAATGVLLLLHLWLASIVVGGLAGAALLAALWSMEVTLPRVFRERPKPDLIPVNPPG